MEFKKGVEVKGKLKQKKFQPHNRSCLNYINKCTPFIFSIPILFYIIVFSHQHSLNYLIPLHLSFEV